MMKGKDLGAWAMPTPEEEAKAKNELMVMEMLARVGGRTLGVELPGDKKDE